MKKEIAILCAGLDNVMRGYETHSRLLFDSLSSEQLESLSFTLYKRTGCKKNNEKILRVPGRESKIVKILAKKRGNNLYWEYLFFGLRFLIDSFIKRKKYSKILIIEPMVSKTIYKFRKLLPAQPEIIFTHGVWMEPNEYTNFAHIYHQVNIENYNKQIEYFNQKKINNKVYLIPHFLPPKNILKTKQNNENLKKYYNIQTENILLSVGVINRPHKNMEYLILHIKNVPV